MNPEKDTSLEVSPEEIEKLKAQEPSLDPIGGWFKNGYGNPLYPDVKF